MRHRIQEDDRQVYQIEHTSVPVHKMNAMDALHKACVNIFQRAHPSKTYEQCQIEWKMNDTRCMIFDVGDIDLRTAFVVHGTHTHVCSLCFHEIDLSTMPHTHVKNADGKNPSCPSIPPDNHDVGGVGGKPGGLPPLEEGMYYILRKRRGLDVVERSHMKGLDEYADALYALVLYCRDRENTIQRSITHPGRQIDTVDVQHLMPMIPGTTNRRWRCCFQHESATSCNLGTWIDDFMKKRSPPLRLPWKLY